MATKYIVNNAEGQTINGQQVPSPYKVYTALLTQSGGNDVYTETEQTGPFTIGKTYTISTYISGDDFTNVGAPSNGDGISFVATGTTAANWTNGSTLTYNNGAPIVTVLENTIGDIWFTYDDIGSYIVLGDFPLNKTTCIISNIGQVPGDDISVRANISMDNIYITTTSVSFAGTSAYSDNILQTTPIEIRVYN